MATRRQFTSEFKLEIVKMVNAVMERFFRNLKQEQVWRYSYVNHREAQQSISSYILDVYNSTRLHSTLKYLSPNAFEAKMRDTQPSNEVVT